jgi:alpha-glucosidase
VGDDLLIFVREHPEGSVLVAARRSAAPAVDPPAGPLGFGDGALLLTTGADRDLAEIDGVVTVPATDGPSFSAWSL